MTTASPPDTDLDALRRARLAAPAEGRPANPSLIHI